MKHINTKKYRGMFSPLINSTSVQSAMMVLSPGQSSSRKVENEHPRAEQWVYVVSGSGIATVGRRTLRIKMGSLLLIRKRETHKITNSGNEQLVTLDFYAPPAYTSHGEVRANVATH
jgi:mannose-6-phosphate isomerase-like protein (cupin superfamily)